MSTSEFSLVETSTAEHDPLQSSALETRQFSANLFAGPCFGDLTPSESSLATLPDAPSPSPLLLNAFADSSSQITNSRQTEDLIDFTDAEEIVSDDMFCPPSSRPDFTHNPIPDNSTTTSTMDSSSTLGLQRSMSPTPAERVSTLASTSPVRTSGSAVHIPMLQAEDSFDISFPLGLDEESLVLDSNHPSNANGNDVSDLTSSEPETPQTSSTLHASSSQTEAVTRTLPIDFMSDHNVDMLDPSVFPSSSPIDESASSPTFPLTPPTYSSSQLPSDATDPIMTSPHLSLTPEHSRSPHSTASDPLSSSMSYNPEIPVHFATSLPSCDICSSPLSSSPEPVFSSSPPAASDFSGFSEDLHFTTDKSELNMAADSTDLSSPGSSPQQHSSPLMLPTQMERDPLLTQDHFNEPPPSSSPLQSSSPSLQYMELAEQPPSLMLNEVDANFNPTEVPEPEPPETLLSTPNQVLQASVQELSAVPPPNPTSLGLQDLKALSRPSDVIMDDSDENVLSSRKRKRQEEEGEPHKEIAAQPPNPKRPTLASQKLQRKTLAKPFRSPAMTPKAPDPPVLPPPPKKVTSLEQPSNDFDLKKKHRTQRAAAQFKSPLSSAASSSIPSSVRQTPTIQALERQVQVLRRAVKVRKEGEEETLESLVKKWTEAGREVAWEVWGLIKDNQSGSREDWGKDSQEAGSGKRRFEDSWGWNEDSGSKRIKVEERERNWGWEVSPAAGDTDEHQTEQPVEAIEEDKPQDTLGTMLMRLGIAPTTLGWKDDEGEFVDE